MSNDKYNNCESATEPHIVIPAKAGIQAGWGRGHGAATPPPMDSRLRGNDEGWGAEMDRAAVS